MSEALGTELASNVSAAPPLGNRLSCPSDDLRVELRVANSLEPRDLLVQLSSGNSDHEDESDDGEDEGERESDHDGLL